MQRLRSSRRAGTILSVLLAWSAAADAATLTVNSTGDDTTAADGLVTLREAIAAAEADGTTDLGETGSGADLIVFDPALTMSGDATITVGTVGDTRFGPSAFVVTTDVTIQGPSGESGIFLMRSGAVPSLRHFAVADTGALTLENLQIAGGRAKGGDGGTNLGDDGGGGGGGAGLGGAVLNAGILSVRGCTLAGNVAEGGAGGAGADNVGDDSGGGGGGGGLGGNGGNLPDDGSNGGGGGGGTFGNGGDGFSQYGGGGGGTATNGDSGGNPGTLNGGTGGGLNVAGTDATGPGGGGGGGGDEAAGGAGGFGGGGGGAGEHDSGILQIGGAGGFGGGGGGGGEDQDGGPGGFGGGGGGGSNDGAVGPAVSAAGGFGGGAGGDDGSGAVVESAGGGGGAGLGGAIFNLYGNVTLENSTLSANTATGGAGGSSPVVLPGTPGRGLGGGLFNLNGNVTVANTTFASNAAELGADSYNLAHVEDLQVVGSPATLSIEDSIFDTALAGNLANEGFDVPASEAQILTVGASLVRSTVDNSNGTVDGTGLSVADAQLGALTDNGGPTATHAPAYPGSPAIDAAADGPATDQRGEARPQGEAFDSGAVEVLQSCGDGVLNAGEECDDGNNVDGDGCSATCVISCAAGPEAMCVPAAQASLSVDERKPGKEKVKASLKKFASAVAGSDFGDPVADDTGMRLCVYDAADALVLDLPVQRAGDLCGPKQKPCWKALADKGFAYKDPLAEASGVTKIGAKGGAAGKGSIVVAGKNDPKKGLTSLPTGTAAALQGATGGTVQVLATDGGCFEGALTTVKIADGTQFKAKAP